MGRTARSVNIICALGFLVSAPAGAKTATAVDTPRVYTNEDVDRLEPLPTSSVRIDLPKRILPVTDPHRWAVIVGAWPAAPTPRALAVPATEDDSTFAERRRPRRHPRRYRPTVVVFP